MEKINPEFQEIFNNKSKDLFLQRSIIFFWLGIIFFPLFSIVDFFTYREHVEFFLAYRIGIALTLVAFILILRTKPSHIIILLLTFTGYLLGGFTITLMIINVDGFASSYYVGLLLIAVGGFALLPITVLQAAFSGFALYFMYTASIFLFTETGEESTKFLINNSFFFISIIAVSLLQCHEKTQSRIRKFNLNIQLKSLNKDLSFYTHHLEDEVNKRVKKIEDSELRYKELYNNILDLMVLINSKTNILMANKHFSRAIGQTTKDILGKSFLDIVHPSSIAKVADTMLPTLLHGKIIRDFQFQIRSIPRKKIDVECNARSVSKKGQTMGFQFVIRDISERKKLENKLIESYSLIDKSQTTAILALAKLSEFRDKDTGNHLERMREYSQILAKELSSQDQYKNYITPEYIDDIYLSSILHDIGKVGIPDTVLLKPGKLSVEEFEIMKCHSVFGGDTLLKSEMKTGEQSFLSLGKAIAYNHHEKWDGSGYPYGLKGKDIPLSARIVALADVYDALTSKRCYKSAFGHEKAKNIIMESKGSHFDPEVVDAFLSTEAIFQQTRINNLVQ